MRFNEILSPDEFARLFEHAGFELLRAVPTQSPVGILEARPAR